MSTRTCTYTCIPDIVRSLEFVHSVSQTRQEMLYGRFFFFTTNLVSNRGNKRKELLLNLIHYI